MAKQRPAALDTSSTRPLQQGDVFVHAMVALTGSGSGFTPVAAGLRTCASLSAPPEPALEVVGARCVVMVVSHDCQLDKEVNQAARRLMRNDPGLTEDDAYDLAEHDDALDRNVVVSPVLALDELPAAQDPSMRGSLGAGQVIGYVPLRAQDPVLPMNCVVDLGIRVTVDRLTLTGRLASSTDATRLALRYALAKMDSLRTPDIGAEIEAITGKMIRTVHAPTPKNPHVRLTMADGTTLDVLPRPAATPAPGPGRTRAP